MLQDQGVILTNAQDKAIWKVAVDNGKGWKNSFTLLKLPPALIWDSVQDRPPSYQGTLTIEAGNVMDSIVQAEAVSPDPKTSVAVADLPDVVAMSPAMPIDDSAEIAALLDLLDSASPASPSAPEAVAAPEAVETLPEPLRDVSAPTPSSEDSASGSLPIVEMPTADATVDLGQGFVRWLREGLITHKIIINDTKALVHTVSGTAMLVTPGIFKRFVQEFPALEAQAKAREVNAWQLVQRAFEKQKLHMKTDKSLNIWTCTVTGPRSTKQLKGYLLKDPLTLFVDVPFDNPSLSLPMAPTGAAT